MSDLAFPNRFPVIAKMREDLAATLDIEKTMEIVLRAVADIAGPTNSVLFHADHSGDFTIDGYMDYKDKESLIPNLENLTDDVLTLLGHNPESLEHVAEKHDFLKDCHLLSWAAVRPLPADEPPETIIVIFRTRQSVPFPANTRHNLKLLTEEADRHLREISRIKNRIPGLYLSEPEPE